jgi:hypothetical protein
MGEQLPLESQAGPLQKVEPNDVIQNGVIIGRDPDPFIRGEILRHHRQSGGTL